MGIASMAAIHLALTHNPLSREFLLVSGVSLGFYVPNWGSYTQLGLIYPIGAQIPNWVYFHLFNYYLDIHL